MERSPLVSIIVPIYNGEKYIDDCMQALSAQSYSNIEIILVNDGSTDNSSGRIARYAADSRVKVVNRANGGLSAARNSGLEVASGEFVMFVDVDDTIHPNLVEIAVRTAIKNDSEVVIYDWHNVSPEAKMRFVAYDEMTTPQVPFDSAFDYYMQNGDVSVSACRSLYKTSLLRDNKFLEGVRYEDFDFTMRLIRKLGKGVHIKWPAYNYVQTPNSIIRSPITLDKISDMCRVLRHVAAEYRKADDKRLSLVQRTRIGETAKKMILKPIQKLSGPEGDKLKREAMKLFGALVRDRIVAYNGFSLRWWPTLFLAGREGKK